MLQIASITSQGQLSIPKSFLQGLGITSATKAIIERKGQTLVISPKKDFWSLGRSLKSSVKLTDAQLKEARESFSRNWAQND
jgi:bifunctional DNA-binding transcriptional regulator/antitoxin component of YhaV-PrlF toxin-antitoxin module